MWSIALQQWSQTEGTQSVYSLPEDKSIQCSYYDCSNKVQTWNIVASQANHAKIDPLILTNTNSEIVPEFLAQPTKDRCITQMSKKNYYITNTVSIFTPTSKLALNTVQYSLMSKHRRMSQAQDIKVVNSSKAHIYQWHKTKCVSYS